MQDATLKQLKTILAKAHAEAVESRRRAPEAERNMRYFAGNDSQVLNRIPVVQKLHRSEASLISPIEEALSAIGRIEAAHNELRSM